jgi:hypothetical protein
MDFKILPDPDILGNALTCRNAARVRSLGMIADRLRTPIVFRPIG